MKRPPSLPPSQALSISLGFGPAPKPREEGVVNSKEKAETMGENCYKSLPREGKSARCFLEDMHKKALPSPGAGPRGPTFSPRSWVAGWTPGAGHG